MPDIGKIIEAAEEAVEATAPLLTGQSPPPIDTTQPIWVQQERRLMFDIMQVLTVVSSIVSMLVLLYANNNKNEI